MRRLRSLRATVAVTALASVFLASGCDIKTFEEACEKDKAGVYSSDRDSCTIKSGSRKGRKGTELEETCIKDNKVIDEREGSCS